MIAPPIHHLALVGVGGFLGSTLRFIVGVWVFQLTGPGGFPWATLLVNVTGCLLIGLIAGFGDLHGGITSELRSFVIVGVLGGFTTFSAFAYETFALTQADQAMKAVLNVVVSTGLGFAAAWLGHASARLL
jgi:CrcB protein